MEFELVDIIAWVAGFILSFLLEIPVIQKWYGNLGKSQKAGVAALIGLVPCLVIFAISCGVTPIFGVACSVLGAGTLLRLWFQLFIANQVAYIAFTRHKK